MAFCPKCQSADYREHKSWDVKSKGGKKEIVRVTVFSCRSCGSKFRVASKITPTHATISSHRPSAVSIPMLKPTNSHQAVPQQASASSETTLVSAQNSSTAATMSSHESLIHRLWDRLNTFF